MKLENQVVSLELAQKMKDKGFKQESLHYWYLTNLSGTADWIVTNGRFPSSGEFCSAYTVAELGEMLPMQMRSWKWGSKEVPAWSCEAYESDIDFDADTEADARAKMLIYLKENNLINL